MKVVRQVGDAEQQANAMMNVKGVPVEIDAEVVTYGEVRVKRTIPPGVQYAQS